MDDGFKLLIQMMAQAAWQPMLQTASVAVMDGSGMSHSVPTVTTMPSPLVGAVARELATAVREDPEIREIFLTGLKEAMVTDEFRKEMFSHLAKMWIRESRGYGYGAGAHEPPDFVKEALKEHLMEWLGNDTEMAQEVVERMLSQGSITVTVERASSEKR